MEDGPAPSSQRSYVSRSPLLCFLLKKGFTQPLTMPTFPEPFQQDRVHLFQISYSGFALNISSQTFQPSQASKPKVNV